MHCASLVLNWIVQINIGFKPKFDLKLSFSEKLWFYRQAKYLKCAENKGNYMKTDKNLSLEEHILSSNIHCHNVHYTMKDRHIPRKTCITNPHKLIHLNRLVADQLEELTDRQ